MKYLVRYFLRSLFLFHLFFLFTSCSEDLLDIDFDKCGFYSYIKVATTCECLNNPEPNCEINYSMLTEKEYERINALFNASEKECIEISGVNFSGKNFSGMAQRPFVDNCAKFF